MLDNERNHDALTDVYKLKPTTKISENAEVLHGLYILYIILLQFIVILSADMLSRHE